MLEIERNIPVPTYRRSAMKPVNLEMLEAMMTMDVGSSFLVNEARRHVSVFVTKRGKVLGKKFSTVIEGDKTRVWRIS
jgi:hypothetical protein